jgi:hypothetical protein
MPQQVVQMQVHNKVVQEDKDNMPVIKTLM